MLLLPGKKHRKGGTWEKASGMRQLKRHIGGGIQCVRHLGIVILGNSGKNWDHFGSLGMGTPRIIYLGSSRVSKGYLATYGIIAKTEDHGNDLKLFGIFSNYLELFRIIWTRPGSPGIIENHVGSSWLIWYHPGPCGIMWDHLGSSGIIWDHLQ